MNFKEKILEIRAALPPAANSPFCLYSALCDEIGNDYFLRKAANIFFELDKGLNLAEYLSGNPSAEEFEAFCQSGGASKDELESLKEALFPTSTPPREAKAERKGRKAKTAPQKDAPKPVKTPKAKAPRAAKVTTPPLSMLDENTLVHYASTDPARGSDDTLHVDFDCPRLKSAWTVFRQPLFEAKAQRPWRLCPHCAGTTPMLFSGKRSKWGGLNLTVMNDKEKQRARKLRGF